MAYYVDMFPVNFSCESYITKKNIFPSIVKTIKSLVYHRGHKGTKGRNRVDLLSIMNVGSKVWRCYLDSPKDNSWYEPNLVSVCRLGMRLGT